MDEITIKIYLNSDGDYNYDIYDTNDVDDETESIDGGTCTSNLLNALDMAVSQAQTIIKNR